MSATSILRTNTVRCTRFGILIGRRQISSLCLLSRTFPRDEKHFPILAIRHFSDKDNDDKNDIKGDPFGVNFKDGPEGLGPSSPPIYKRDAATGFFTGEVEPETTVSGDDRRILEADPAESDQILMDHIEEHWKSEKDQLNELGQRVRETNMATNVLGRSPKAQASVEQLDDGTEMGRDEYGFSQKLSPEEMETYKSYMKKEHDVDVNDDDIPAQTKTKRTIGSVETDPESRELALKWLTSRAQRQMDDVLDDNPFSDVMPGDLSPTRLVNRKRAKPIPIQLLHHNNLALLRTFSSDAGLIRHRVQTRLGARDQRRVAKLIKRARALGLMPHEGQFKVENHGWVNEPDIDEEREWEKELANRGLVIKDQPAASPTAKS